MWTHFVLTVLTHLIDDKYTAKYTTSCSKCRWDLWDCISSTFEHNNEITETLNRVYITDDALDGINEPNCDEFWFCSDI